MKIEEILKHIEKTLNELENIYVRIFSNNTLNLGNDNLILGMEMVSKIYGLATFLPDSFVEENHLEQLIEMINIDHVKIEAAHYNDQHLFYDFVNIIYPQLQFRFNIIRYRYSLKEETRNKLLITKRYYLYLVEEIKEYLELELTEEIKKEIEEILTIVHLYQVYDGNDKVCLGSKITYLDSFTNEEEYGTIVIPSHANKKIHKLSINDFQGLLSAKVGQVAFLNFAFSYYVKVLAIENNQSEIWSN